MKDSRRLSERNSDSGKMSPKAHWLCGKWWSRSRRHRSLMQIIISRRTNSSPWWESDFYDYFCPASPQEGKVTWSQRLMVLERKIADEDSNLITTPDDQVIAWILWTFSPVELSKHSARNVCCRESIFLRRIVHRMNASMEKIVQRW